MAGLGSISAVSAEEGCSDFLVVDGATLDQAQQRRRSAWPGAAAAAVAGALLLVGAVVAASAVGGRGGAAAPSPAVSDAVQLFAGTYEDPQGQTVCSASQTNQGDCKCLCDWAQAPGACQQRTDDDTCCYACCCPGGGGGVDDAGMSPLAAGEDGLGYSHGAARDGGYDGDSAVYGGTYQHHGGDYGGAYPEGFSPSATVHHVHVTHHYDHYHAVNGHSAYHVGQQVFVTARDGRTWAAEVVAANPDGTYRVSYIAHGSRGPPVLVSASHISAGQPSAVTPTFWWVLLGLSLLGLGIFACFVLSKPRA